MGSIIKRGENTYLLMISAGFDQNGKRVRITKTFHGSKPEARRELARMESEGKKKDRLTAPPPPWRSGLPTG